MHIQRTNVLFIRFCGSLGTTSPWIKRAGFGVRSDSKGVFGKVGEEAIWR